MQHGIWKCYTINTPILHTVVHTGVVNCSVQLNFCLNFELIMNSLVSMLIEVVTNYNCHFKQTASVYITGKQTYRYVVTMIPYVCMCIVKAKTNNS